MGKDERCRLLNLLCYLLAIFSRVLYLTIEPQQSELQNGNSIAYLKGLLGGLGEVADKTNVA